MTVKVTLEFPNIDVAIVELAKLSKAAGTVIVDGKPRKGRADKGQPRGPQKATANVTEPVAAPAAQPKAGESKPEVASPEPAPAVASTGPTPSEADAQKALEKLFESKNLPEGVVPIDAARDTMARFGVKRIRELKPEQRADFIKLAEEVAAGKVKP